MVITDEIVKIKDAIIQAVPAERIYLFGSYANGTPNENSDYDFYVVLANDSLRPIEAIGNVYMAMRGIKRKPVDILAGTAEIFEQRSKQISIEQKIAREGVILYERGK
jgi:predicted nucleotidyltransferase